MIGGDMVDRVYLARRVPVLGKKQPVFTCIAESGY